MHLKVWGSDVRQPPKRISHPLALFSLKSGEYKMISAAVLETEITAETLTENYASMKRNMKSRKAYFISAGRLSVAG